MPVSKYFFNKKFLIFFLTTLLLLGVAWHVGNVDAGSLAQRGVNLHLIDGWAVVPAFAAANDQSGALTNANCIMCHQDQQLNGYTRDSLQVSLTVDEQAFNQSVHGQAGVLCVGCHSTFTTYPHSDVEQVTCEQCHVENATIVASLPHDNGRAMEAHFNESCRNF